MIENTISEVQYEFDCSCEKNQSVLMIIIVIFDNQSDDEFLKTFAFITIVSFLYCY